jgi:S1-C subfamily serine protease
MPQRNPASHLVSGALGGLIAVMVGAILIATGVIDTGKKTTVVEQAQIASPGSDAPKGTALKTVHQIYQQVGPGVAFIQSRLQSGASPLIPTGSGSGTATGSGVALDKRGYILTNAHVVEGASKVVVRFGTQDPVEATTAGRDPSTDLAVIKVDPSKTKLAPLELGDSNKVRVGDQVIAVGNPFGLDNTVTTGIISALQRSIDAPNGFSIDHVIQTDASINPGNSGGPLLDATGRVIGINAQIETGGTSNGSVGIGFAIPIDTAKQVVPQLESTGHVEHAYIGITTGPITKKQAHDLHLPVMDGALVRAVSPGSPAAKAGIRAGARASSGLVGGGDLVVEVAGTRIGSPLDVSTAIATRKPGETVPIKLYRDGKLLTVSVTLAKRPARVPGQNSLGGLRPFPGVP